jgi:two-component system cell cycle sensor histidine kinase/response regulator CckA
VGASRVTTSLSPMPVAGMPRHRRAMWVAAALGWYALAAGLVSFAGWVFDVRRLTAWGGGISIQPNTALAVVAAGAGLVLLTQGRRRAVVPFALLCALIGLATLFEHVSGMDLGIDTLLTFGRPWAGTATVSPGRMGPPASTSWSLLGIGLLAALGDRRTRQAAAALALAAGIVGALSLIGYLFGANPLYAVAPLTAIALQTTTMIIALAVGLVTALGDTQPVGTLLEQSGAGLLARRALPLVIVVPLVLGLLRLRGQQAGWYDTGMGVALLVLALIIAMSAVLWWCVGAVSAHEHALGAATRTVRENEAQFRRLADAIPQIVWVLDGEGKVTFINQQWRIYTGWSDGAVGDTTFGVHPEDLRPMLEGWDQARQAGLEYTAEFRLRAASDGSYRWHLCRVVPIRGEGGRVVQWYGTLTDIHDRKQAEEQLRQAAKMEAIGRLAGGVAHDFNNQLSAVSGFATFAARDPGLGARARQDLQEILKATERMAGLTRQLLAFSRQQVLQPETLQLNAAVLDGSSLLQRLIGSHIEFRLDLTADPTWIRVDRAQLLQVLMNLAINARDAMSRDGILDIRTGRLEITGREPPNGVLDAVPSGSYVLLSVSDNGAGIRPEHLPHVFEPFFTTKEPGQGTGLGLATVHGIVSQSQGHIRVESRPGEGTRFTVLFPAVSAPTDVGAVAADRPGRTPRAARLLVVDDEDAVRAVLSRTLEAEGYEVSQARNGREALERLAGIRGVDAVLTDVIMPELGGRELVERLAADYAGLPVIWMSGYPRDATVGDGGSSGAQPFLQKPIPPDVLIQAVEDVLSRRAAAS